MSITTMKLKYLLKIAALLLVAALSSCSSDDLIEEGVAPGDAQSKMIKFVATIGPKSEGTRLLEDQETEVTSTWNEDDRIAMIINGTKYEGTVETVDNDGYAIVTGEITAVPTGTSITFRYPYAAVNEEGNFHTDVLLTQDGTLDDIDTRTGMSETTGELLITEDETENKMATLKERVVLENQIAICRFQFTGINNISKVIITDNDGIHITDICLPSDTKERSKVYVAMLPIATQSKLTFIVTPTAGDKIYKGTTNARLQSGFYYKAQLNLTEQEIEYVDLGLKTKWAKWNVGATKETEWGELFAWAETTGHSYLQLHWGIDLWNPDWNKVDMTDLASLMNGSLSWDDFISKYPEHSGLAINYVPTKPHGFFDSGETCPYLNNMVATKYTGSDYDVLQPEDDAATVNWGADWCTPTKEDWDELYQNTKRTWTKRDGVYGMLFTSVVPGYEGRSIFLPAAGHGYGADLFLIDKPGNPYGSYAGVFEWDWNGHYWSSSYNLDYNRDAYYTVIRSFDEDPTKESTQGPSSTTLTTSCSRIHGFSIRPVLRKESIQ